MKYIFLLITINYVLKEYSCGKINSKSSSRKPSLAFIEDVPYVASFVERKNRFTQRSDLLICTVAIVHLYYALCAQHCLRSIDSSMLSKRGYVVRGNSSFWEEATFSTNHEVVAYHAYKPSGDDSIEINYFSTNIALLQVKQRFDGKYEIPIPVAPSNYKYVATKPAKVIGWAVIDVSHFPVARLQSVHTKIADFKDCKNIYWNTMLATLSNKMLCAYAFRNEMCYGDSGGPLVQDGVLIGIASFGEECSGDHVPDVYTRVAHFNKWINDAFTNTGKRHRARTVKNYKPPAYLVKQNMPDKRIQFERAALMSKAGPIPSQNKKLIE